MLPCGNNTFSLIEVDGYLFEIAGDIRVVDGAFICIVVARFVSSPSHWSLWSCVHEEVCRTPTTHVTTRGETHEFPEGNIIPVGASRDARDMGVIRAVLSLQVFPRRNTVIVINRLLLVGSPSL